MTLAFAPERIEHWQLARLQPYARNAKLHGEHQVARIAASMAEFGWTVPCVAAEDGELIAGHGRVLAATQLGLTEAPVIVLGHLTEAQRRAYRLADNKLSELSSWDEAALSAELQHLLADDYDLSLVGFSDGELDRLLAFDPDGGGEEEGGAGGSVPPVTIPEPPRNPASRTGDLWILGDDRLLCGDSTSHEDVRRLMNGERAVLFATDQPYLVDYDGSNHPTPNKDWSQSYGVTWGDSSRGAELYDGFIAAAVAEAIADNAAWYCWHASRRQAMLEACWEKAGAFVHQQIIWVKDRGVLTRSHYLWKHEPCYMGWRRPNRPPKVAEETLPSTWEMPSFAKDERPDHPTPKPAARGAARWTSSLRAIRASRSPSQANAGGRTTRATSGRMSPASSARSSRPSSSSRTSPIISASVFPKSPADWSAWATSLRQASSRRRKSARPTGASGCSSLPSVRATSWPTPRACSGNFGNGVSNWYDAVYNLQSLTSTFADNAQSNGTTSVSVAGVSVLPDGIVFAAGDHNGSDGFTGTTWAGLSEQYDLDYGGGRGSAARDLAAAFTPGAVSISSGLSDRKALSVVALR